MPHLQFEINKCVNNVTKQKFVIFIEKSFSRIMQTGTDHIAISVREYEKENLKDIKNETLVIWGDKDRSYNFDQVSMLNNNIPNCKIEIFNLNI